MNFSITTGVVGCGASTSHYNIILGWCLASQRRCRSSLMTDRTGFGNIISVVGYGLQMHRINRRICSTPTTTSTFQVVSWACLYYGGQETTEDFHACAVYLRCDGTDERLVLV